MTKKVTATFTGANGSIGYIHGKDYELNIIQPTNSMELRVHRLIDGKGVCEYSNTIVFFDNWTNIKTI